MRVVLDTNIWISGIILPKSQAGKVISAWEQARLTIVTSNSMLLELKKVLSYPKIKKRTKWKDKKINQYIEFLKFFTEVIPNNNISIKLKRDPNDSHVLATLINSQADYLIAGDDDLLSLNESYPIITLAEFCRNL